MLGEILQEAGLPDGLYQVLQGEGEAGRLITDSPDIDKMYVHPLDSVNYTVLNTVPTPSFYFFRDQKQCNKMDWVVARKKLGII